MDWKNIERLACEALRERLKGKPARFPEPAMQLLDAFTALCRARSYGPNGPNPITWEALAAWSQVMRVPIRPHHAATLMALDEVWMSHALKGQNIPAGAKTLPPVSSQAITAELFDLAIG